MSIDELIVRLSEIREIIGGDNRGERSVLIEAYGLTYEPKEVAVENDLSTFGVLPVIKCS